MEMRDRLRSAISSGTLALTDKLNERGDTVAEISGTDSLDLVELAMAREEKGTKLETVDDLLHFLDGMKDDYET
jgi:acyl carrier protein